MNRVQMWAIGVTIPLLIATVAGGFTLVTQLSQQSRELGRIEAENNHLSTQNTELRQQNSSMRARLDDLVNSNSSSSSSVSNLEKILEDYKARLAQAYSQIESLHSDNARLAHLADSTQRCAPYKEQITDMQNELTGRERYSLRGIPGQERKAEIYAHLQEHNATLRACLAAQP